MRSAMMNKPAILFVCSHNRCRSLAAEAVFRYITQASQVLWSVDSAGLIAHAGQPAEILINDAAALRGYNLERLRSRLFAHGDFYRFDYIVAVDDNIQALLLQQTPQACPVHISLLMSYSAFFHNESNLDYPCSSGIKGFVAMLDRIEDACLGLFHFVQKQLEDSPSRLTAESD